MGRKKIVGTPISDDTAKRIAHIIGNGSACNLALQEAKRRRANGEVVGLFLTDTMVLVGPYPEDMPFEPEAS